MHERNHRRDDIEAPNPYGAYALPIFTTGDQRKREIIEALHALPPVVYYTRVRGGLIKIGHTTNLHKRLHHLGADREDLLIIIPGDREMERQHHQMWSAHLARGREWFRECEEILTYVNSVRDSYGVPDAA